MRMNKIKSKKVRDTKLAPPIYQDYIKKEKSWIKKKIKHTSSLIDVGCGEGRAVSFLSKLTDSYMGVDFDSKAISKAKKLENKKIKFKILDVTKLSDYFSRNSFEISVCLWNTIGNIENDERAIKEMYKITSKRCFITTLKKGNVKERIHYYNSYKINYKLDKRNEIFYSDAWGIARAYSRGDFKTLCRNVGFKVVSTVDLGKIGFGVELKK